MTGASSRGWIPVAFLGLAVGIGCGAASPARPTTDGPGTAEIERVRADAAAHPNDPAAQRALAEWELLSEGGDPDRVEAAIARAERLAPNDVALAFVHGLFAEQRGHADEALDAFLEVLVRAPASDDPMAPFYAESAFAYLRDLKTNAPRFRERTGPIVASFLRAPGHAGASGWRQALFWQMADALTDGNPTEARRIEALAGCPETARVAGPFGPSILTPFDVRLPAEGPGPLAARYDLGPGRGVVDTRSVDAQQCSLSLGSPRNGGAGVRVVEATLHAASSGRHVLMVATGASVQVAVDGTVIDRVDRRRAQRGALSFHALDLSAGDHELELKVASRDASPSIGWMLHPAMDGVDPGVGTAIPEETHSPAELFALVDVLALRGEAVEARERVRGATGRYGSTALLLLEARVVVNDPFSPSTRREDEERRLVTLAHERDPRAHVPALRLAELTEDAVEQLAALRGVADRFPGLVSVQLRLSGALREAGYEADADRAIARAAEAMPGSCAVARARLDSLADRGRVDETLPLARELVGCDARDRILFEHAMNAHDWAGARAELERLAPMTRPEGRRQLSLRLARASGDAAEERRLVAEAEADDLPGEHVVADADRRYLADDRLGALRLIEAEAAREPRHASDLRRLTYALSGSDVMEPHRVDGRAAIDRFLASGRAYEGQAAVLLHDYMVTRVFEDGTSLHLIHQIFLLQSAEGVARFGDLRLPGRVLTVRAIGRDGSVREPDRIAESIDMPPLEIGDYVEYEYIREEGPSWGDGFVSGGWIFQNYSQPFDHSEMVFVAPADMDLRFDVRGPVPPPEVQPLGALRTYRFVMDEQRALAREPNSLADPPILPSVRAGARVTWDRIYEAVYDRTLDLDPVDPAAVRLLEAEILRGAPAGARARAARIHRWVMENVDPVDDSFYASAPIMLAERRGHQLRVMRYLLELAGVPARIAFARSMVSPTPSADVPDTRVYDGMVVVAEVDGVPLYLASLGRGVAHDALPAALLGQDAIVLAPGLPHVTLPARQGPAPAQRVRADVELDSTGRARVHLLIAFAGAAGGELREAIRRLPPAERSAILAERFAPSLIPGAATDPRTVVVRNLEDWEQDLELELVALSAGLAVRAEGGIRLLPLFQSGVESNFARLPSRTTTELVGDVDTQISMRVRGPGAMRPPEPGRVAGPAGSSTTLEVARGPDGSIVLERHVRVPLGAVPVAQYPALVRFCRETSALEERTVVFGGR